MSKIALLKSPILLWMDNLTFLLYVLVSAFNNGKMLLRAFIGTLLSLRKRVAYPENGKTIFPTILHGFFQKLLVLYCKFFLEDKKNN